jgi:TPP-dependent pyruvate/acetoin dehydrogenase alpha subunit
MTWFGEGSTANGVWHEAMNVAGVRKLPLVLVLENNQFAYSTPLRLQSRTDFATKAVAYGIPGEKVDGTDVVAVYEATKRAVDRARAGEGPSLIECVTMRMHGHAEHDPADYVPPEMFEEWAKKDPVELFAARIQELGFADADEVAAMREEARQQGIQARKKSLSDPMPQPDNEEARVYAS